MISRFHRAAFALAFSSAILTSSATQAHKLRTSGEKVNVASSGVTVLPQRDWNSLDVKVGKNTETWTLDGELLNEVTFFGGIPIDKPLVKEVNKKTEPLPKFTSTTLAIEIPELLERSYRVFKNSKSFTVISAEPGKFLGREGVFFSYEFTDESDLVRKGEARAAIIGEKLYMITFEAPRLNYFDRTLKDFNALADSARLEF